MHKKRKGSSNDQLYNEKLDWFKQNEKPDPVLLIANESQLMRIVVAWGSTEIKRKKSLSELHGKSENKVWLWLWENAEYAREELISKSGVSETTFDNKLATLIGNRVIYPDSTINSFVQRYLRAKVLRLLDIKPGRAASRAG